jgi:hypothetical protein
MHMAANAQDYVRVRLQKLSKWAAADAARPETNSEIEDTKGRRVRNDDETLVPKGRTVPLPHEVGEKALGVQ